MRQLNALVAVAETGSVTRAAEILRLVQPAVTRQIRQLEQELGVALFERSRHGMELTEPGRVLLESARRAISELERGRAEIQPESGHLTGTVTVGLLPSTADLLAETLLTGVRRLHPGVMLRIAVGYAGTLRDWLEDGRADLALVYDIKKSLGIHVHPLVRESLWAVAAAHERLSTAQAVTFHGLADHPLIMPSAPHGLRALVEAASARTGIDLTIVAETNAINVQKRLVAQGIGWTVLPAIAIADDVARGTLSAAQLHQPTIERTVALGLPHRHRMPRAVNAVRELLVKQMANAVAAGQWPAATWIDT